MACRMNSVPLLFEFVRLLFNRNSFISNVSYWRIKVTVCVKRVSVKGTMVHANETDESKTYVLVSNMKHYATIATVQLQRTMLR